MDTKLIIVFVVINLIFAGVIGVNTYFYSQTSKAKFRGIVKTEEENIEHVIEDYFKDSELSKQVIGDILQDSVNVVDENVGLEFTKQKSNFIRGNREYALTVTLNPTEKPDDYEDDKYLTIAKDKYSYFNSDDYKDIGIPCQEEHYDPQTFKFTPNFLGYSFKKPFIENINTLLKTGKNVEESDKPNDHKDVIIQLIKQNN